MRSGVLLPLVLLAACAAPPDLPPPGTPLIEIATGGAFSGTIVTRIHADDTLEHEMTGPFGADPFRRVAPATPGTFARVAAALTAAAPAALAAVDPEAPPCPDYGADAIRAEPPIDGFSQLVSGCPDPAMDAFVAAVTAAIAPPP